MMKYIASMGGLYKLRNDKWRAWLKAKAAGDEPDIYEYATYVAGVVDITDMDETEAEIKLEYELEK